MFRRVFLTAILAGLFTGLVISIVQEFTTTPLIHAAEHFENTAANANGIVLAHAGHEQSAPIADGGAWVRLGFTVVANLIIGVGYALILTAIFALEGRSIDGRVGTVWGMAGLAVFTLAPALGLPPEAPGTIAADLSDRQLWWLATALATALALWLMVYGKRWWLHAAAVIVLALPHVIGAPHIEGAAGMGGSVPPEIAARFAATSIAVQAIFWAVLGWSAGAIWHAHGRHHHHHHHHRHHRHSDIQDEL